MRLFACPCCAPFGKSAFLASPADSGSSGGTARPPSGGKVDPVLLEELVAANHILYNENVLDGYGHVSMRHPEHPERFLIARSIAPALVTSEDIVECTLDSELVNPDGPATYLERFIHGSIYKARPDVHAVVHSHSPTVIPFANAKTPMKAMMHTAGFLAGGVPVFDIKEKFGDTNLLVTSNDMGAALAETLADRPVALMRGHGNAVTAHDIQNVVFRAIYTEVNARLMLQARNLDGPVTFLSDAEGEKCNQMIIDTGQRSWALWKKNAGLN